MGLLQGEAMNDKTDPNEWRSPWEVETWKALIISRHERDEARGEACRLEAEATRLARRNTLLVAEIETVRAERDEARREVCGWAARHFSEYEEHIARKRGWDCFTEQTSPTKQQPRSESTSLPDNSGGNDPQDDGA